VCAVCGGEGGCDFIGNRGDDGCDLTYLSADDWRKVYWFMRQMYLPFVHRLIRAARERGNQRGALA
jgi:hypothetical protein